MGSKLHGCVNMMVQLYDKVPCNSSISPSPDRGDGGGGCKNEKKAIRHYINDFERKTTLTCNAHKQ